jgi:hypothetical protein
MAYTDHTLTTPFNKGSEHPEGYDFVTAEELLRKIADTSVGRIYIDGAGNLVYESRLHREA